MSADAPAGGRDASAALAARCAAMATRLRARAAGAPPTADERAALKAEIAALIRQAVDAARAAADVESDARALAALWKALPSGDAPAAPAQASPAPAASAQASSAQAAPAPADARGAPGALAPPVPPATPAAPNGTAAGEAARAAAPEAAGAGSAPPAVELPGGPPAALRRTTRADHLGASTYAARGWTAYAAGDYPSAESAYAQAAALAPDDRETTALHAWSLAAVGRDDDALLAAHRVLTASPAAPAGAAALARVALGRVCLRKGITGEALEHLTRAARDDADRRATLYATLQLGVAYGQRGMHEDAVAFLRRALALGPNLVEAHYALGRAHWMAGAPEAAHEAWRAGAAAGKFSPWAARCEELRLHMAGGGPLPPE